MERRALITGLFNSKKAVQTNESPVSISSTTLTPYLGEWTFGTAGHLLRRTTFGPTYLAINEAVSQGLDETIEQLLTDNPLPAPPHQLLFSK